MRLVVVVDQFEEVFTYRPQDEQAKARFEHRRAAFFANLLHAAARAGGRVAVVLTMRSDFLGACAVFPRLNDALHTHLVQVGPMRQDELREAIERPAYLVGCEVEPALSERLLADVKGQSGALPLLQFALKEVWSKRDVRKLTLDAYWSWGAFRACWRSGRTRCSIRSTASEGDLQGDLPAPGPARRGDRGHEAAGRVSRAPARRPGQAARFRP